MTKTTVLLYVTTFVANATILVFEIAGARLLAPYLGTSVEVWAGTIAVILGGMAFGYWGGGILADRRPEKRELAILLFAAGVAALVAWGLRDLVPLLFVGSLSLPLTLTAMCAAALLFAPTTIFLAAISPFIAKFLLTTLSSSAKTVGVINAVGTLGSIAGAVLSGAFLIPQFGLSSIFLGIAILLLALSALIGRSNIGKKGVVLVIAGLVAIVGNVIGSVSISSILRADITTTYNRIFVRDETLHNRSVRFIQTDPYGTQCGMETNLDGSVNEETIPFSYLQAFDAFARAYPVQNASAQTLFLGGCNYSYPRTFLHTFPNANVTVIELDPGMTEIAKEHFGFHPEVFPTLSIFHEDARRHLMRNEGSYDFIFMGTFGSFSNIPYHLTTKEYFALLKDHLAPKGLLLVNVIGTTEGPSAAFTSSLLETARTSFTNVALYQVDDTAPTTVQNLLLVGSLETSLPEKLSHPLYQEINITRVSPKPSKDTLVLTDDYTPVEHLTRTLRGSIF